MIPAYPDWLNEDSLSAFIAMRKTIKKPLTPHAITLAVKKLDVLRKQGHDPNECLDESTFNSWAGIYAPKAVAVPTSPAQLRVVQTVRVGQAWNLSNEGIIAKAKDCGIRIVLGDSYEAIKTRVQEFLDDPRQRGAL